ncbi:MAG: autotransporter domain-containing protein [Pseudomonadota bacterium]
MKTKLIFTAVALAITAWAPTSSARETVALPYIFGVAPGDSVGQATGLDTTGAGLLTVNPNININTLNDVGGGITSNINNVASILFAGNSTVTGFTGTNLIRFIDITAGANATTVNFNGNVFTTAFNLSGTGTANFNGNLNQGIVAASTNFADDGFINIGTNALFNSAITTNTANTGTFTFNGGSSVIGAIGGANGLKRINLVGGNASVIGAVQARQFDLGANTLTITGALTSNAAGIINTTFASNAVFGKIIVNGNSAIDAGGVTVIPTVTGALTNGTTYRIVEAPSGTNNALVSVINNNPRYTFAGLPTTLGNVDIVLAAIAPLATLVTAPGALAIAPILDVNAAVGTDLRTIQDAIAVLPNTVAINNALTQLAPGNTNLAAPWIAGQATRMFEDQWMARFDEVQNHCCDTTCDPSRQQDEQNSRECGDRKQVSNWWGKANGSIGNQDNRQGMSGYETQAAGLMIGYDVPLNNQTRLGLGGGYTKTSIDDNHSTANTGVDSYQITGYFEYAPQPWFVRAALTAGVDRYDSSRNVSFAGINRDINADYRGKQYNGLVALGKHFYYNETTITPLASLQATHIKVDSFNEKGGGDVGLNVDKQDYDFLQSSLGVKVERVIKTSNGAVSPEAHVRWLHDFNSTTMEQNASFAGGGAEFTAQGIKQDRDLYNVGAGFTMFYCNCEKNAWSVKGLYDYKWNDSEYSSHQVSLIANLNF